MMTSPQLDPPSGALTAGEARIAKDGEAHIKAGARGSFCTMSSTPSTHLKQCCCSSWGLLVLLGEKLGLPAAGIPSTAAYPEQEGSCSTHSNSYSYREGKKITKESPKNLKELKMSLSSPSSPSFKGRMKLKSTQNRCLPPVLKEFLIMDGAQFPYSFVPVFLQSLPVDFFPIFHLNWAT